MVRVVWYYGMLLWAIIYGVQSSITEINSILCSMHCLQYQGSSGLYCSSGSSPLSDVCCHSTANATVVCLALLNGSYHWPSGSCLAMVVRLDLHGSFHIQTEFYSHPATIASAWTRLFFFSCPLPHWDCRQWSRVHCKKLFEMRHNSRIHYLSLSLNSKYHSSP